MERKWIIIIINNINRAFIRSRQCSNLSCLHAFTNLIFTASLCHNTHNLLCTALLSYLFYMLEKWGPEKGSYLPRITQGSPFLTRFSTAVIHCPYYACVCAIQSNLILRHSVRDWRENSGVLWVHLQSHLIFDLCKIVSTVILPAGFLSSCYVLSTLCTSYFIRAYFIFSAILESKI